MSERLQPSANAVATALTLASEIAVFSLPRDGEARTLEGAIGRAKAIGEIARALLSPMEDYKDCFAAAPSGDEVLTNA